MSSASEPRSQLFRDLAALPRPQFEELLFTLGVPHSVVSGTTAPQGDRVADLLRWAAGPTGCGLEAMNTALSQLVTQKEQSASDPVNFEQYLRSLIATYKEWQTYYTLTDAVSKVHEPESERPTSSPFDFGLMVESISKEPNAADPETRLHQEKQERTERLPVLEGVRKYVKEYRHVLLVGRPGSGKSTTLIRLLLEDAEALNLVSSPTKIPVLVELRYWQSSLLEQIQAFLYQHDPALSLDEATLKALLRQGQFWLLVDGVNELPSDKARPQLSAFRRDYPNVPMIFTTRDLGLGGDLGIEKQLEIQPLTETQMMEFVHAYVPDRAETLLHQLSDRLREFGQTPLLLWMLCEVFQQSPEHQLPSNLAGVFQKFTVMYETSAIRKHKVALLKGDVRPLSDRRLWKEALMCLASAMMQGETEVDFRVAMHREEAERELSRAFPNEQFPIRDLLDDLLKYHLLQKRSADQIEFRHQLIQEYYAAEHLLRLLPKLSDEQLKRDYLNLMKWTEAIAMMLVLLNDEKKEQDLLWLTYSIDWDLSSRLISLSSNIHPEQRSEIDDWLDLDPLRKDIPYLIESLSHSDPFERSYAAECLGISSSDMSVSKLIETISDADARVRASAADALGEIGSELAVPRLIEAVDDSDKLVCSAAVHALGKIRSEMSVPVLIKVLNDPNKEFYGKEARALAAIGSEAAIQGLMSAATHESYRVREKVPWAIGLLNSEQAISTLLYATQDPNPNVRCGAIFSLGRFQSEVAIQTLIEAMSDSDESVRMEAINRLGDLKIESAIQPILKTLEDPSSLIRCSSIKALKSIGCKSIVPNLIDSTNDPDKWVRLEAAKALVDFDSDIAIPVLIESIEWMSTYGANNVIRLLAELGSEAALLELIKILKRPDCDEYRVNYFEVSGGMMMPRADSLHMTISHSLEDTSITSEKVILALLNAIENPNPRVHESIGKVLGNIASETAIPRLLELVEHVIPDIRKGATEALGNIRSEAAIPGLIKAAADPVVEIRASATQALAEFDSSEVTQALLSSLEDFDFDVRFYGVKGLSSFDSEEVILALTEIANELDREYRFREHHPLDNLNDIIRSKAMESLGKIGSKSAIQTLLKLIESSDYHIREAAAYALGIVENEVIIKHLPHLQELRPSCYEAQSAISKIQEHYKFYNYEIWQELIQNSKLESQNEDSSERGGITQKFYGPVYGVAGQVAGDQTISPPPDSID